MGKCRKVTVGALVGVALTLGCTDVALAAPVTTATTAASTSSPTTTAPSTTSPSTTGPTTTTPTGTPSTTTPSTAGPKKPTSLTSNQIWWIVRPRHGIDCTHATKQVQRVRTALSAADKRLGRQEAKQAANEKIQGKNAAKRTKASSGKVKGFQKLEQDGQALIRRIDAKCSLTSPAG